MSAIAGILNLNGEPVSLEQGQGMMRAFEKFPANDVQTWHKDHLFLGCHAQWITPESIGEVLPFYDYARQLAITADAIIDNREELFQLLQIHKEDRKKITDSQLILLAYHKWGENCPKHLVGDFAFMIWDEKEQKLFGARDFSGGRTLYYFKDANHFLFSTTLQPIIDSPLVKKELNEVWLAEYLAIIGMIDVCDPQLTVYSQVYQIPPSHSISLEHNRINIRRYHHFDMSNKLKLKDEHEYVDAFQDVFRQAIAARLRTFKQVSSQLSGGLDSGSIVAFARKELPQEQKLYTFTYTPPDDFEDFTPPHIITNESSLVRKTVSYVKGIEDNYVDFPGRNPFSEINDFLEVMEMPYKFFENSFWLKGMYEEAQKVGAGILLNGGRGNLSISWGPAEDYYATLLKKVRWIKLVKELNYYSQNIGGSRFRRIPSLSIVAFPFLENKRFDYTPLINSEFANKSRVYERLRKYGIDQSGWFKTSNVYEQRKRHFTDVSHWNASNTLASKLSLPYSVWKRDPSNDSRVIQFCLSIPEDQYVQKGLDRALLRRGTKNYLPDEIRLNQTTRGVQGADWIHRIKPHMNEILIEIQQMMKEEKIRYYVNPIVLENGRAFADNGLVNEDSINHHVKSLFRILIIYRFLKHLEGR